MMILARKRIVLLLFLASALIAIVPAALGYAHASDIARGEAEDVQSIGQRLLFVGIVAVGALAVAWALFLGHVTNLSGALSRIEDLNRIGGREITAALRRLGDVGETIGRMYAQVNEVSARKSMRISAMDSLLSAILQRCPQRILVVDAQGEVIRATPAALEYLEQGAVAVIGKSIDDIIPQVNFARTRAAVDRSTDLWVPEQTTVPVAVQPIPNAQGQAAYYIHYIGSDARLAAHMGIDEVLLHMFSDIDTTAKPTPAGAQSKPTLMQRIGGFLFSGARARTDRGSRKR